MSISLEIDTSPALKVVAYQRSSGWNNASNESLVRDTRYEIYSEVDYILVQVEDASVSRDITWTLSCTRRALSACAFHVYDPFSCAMKTSTHHDDLLHQETKWLSCWRPYECLTCRICDLDYETPVPFRRFLQPLSFKVEIIPSSRTYIGPSWTPVFVNVQSPPEARHLECRESPHDGSPICQ